MKEIPLTQGKVALVDDEDYDELIKHKWYAYFNDACYYAMTNIKTLTGRTTQRMHRKIMGDIKGVAYDHKDGNGLNNQRINLRAATKQQNLMNTRKRLNCSSEYKGLCWDKVGKKWRVNIGYDGKNICIGRYCDMLEAAIAYDKKAVELFGEYARLNFPELTIQED